MVRDAYFTYYLHWFNRLYIRRKKMSNEIHIAYWRDKCKKLEKALDKACVELEGFCNTYENREFYDGAFTKEEWKEWLLKHVSVI